MPRKPLPLGNWGKIRSYPAHMDAKGKPDSYRAMTYFRDFDGETRQVTAYGRTKTAAEANLVAKCKERSRARNGGSLTSIDRFATGADLWFKSQEQMVVDGLRSPTTIETYRRTLDNHVLRAVGEVRFGEFGPPLVDRVITQIKNTAGVPTAKLCRTVMSGVLSLAVRHGALDTNPTRDIGRLEGWRKQRNARALEASERRTWFEMLRTNPTAVDADLYDLTLFMLGTGVRIGEALGVLWEQVNFFSEEVEVTHQVVRLRKQGLVRIMTKSRAGERTLTVPSWCEAMLRRRFSQGAHRCDLHGHQGRTPGSIQRSSELPRSAIAQGYASSSRSRCGVKTGQGGCTTHPTTGC